MKAYEGEDVYIHMFLTSALVGSEWSASRPGRLYSRYPFDRRLSGPRAGLEDTEKILKPTETRIAI
jgi:hypothetical protein